MEYADSPHSLLGMDVQCRTMTLTGFAMTDLYKRAPDAHLHYLLESRLERVRLNALLLSNILEEVMYGDWVPDECMPNFNHAQLSEVIADRLEACVDNNRERELLFDFVDHYVRLTEYTRRPIWID
ncbi:hypothetical protein GCM10007895_00090 [Paraferrimonas sedimenticola]|uniref:Uncharacterized protein n=2 Tax=Paraferrimonas sedimenticola TaxID=375674 RepID=A0AA37RN29_9GAMM|nr:hypothetical protein GCM10007895_00090 [Paraferrimonas sedimenticola]